LDRHGNACLGDKKIITVNLESFGSTTKKQKNESEISKEGIIIASVFNYAFFLFFCTCTEMSVISFVSLGANSLEA